MPSYCTFYLPTQGDMDHAQLQITLSADTLCKSWKQVSPAAVSVRFLVKESRVLLYFMCEPCGCFFEFPPMTGAFFFAKFA